MDVTNREIPINYTKEAFTHPANLGVLLLATILGFLSGEIGFPVSLVLTMICAAELLYLGIAPKLPRFRENIKQRQLNKHNEERTDQKLFKGLSKKDKRQYLALRQLVKMAEQNFEAAPHHSQGLLESICRKVDELLSQYLTLTDRYKRYELYMNTAIEDRLKEEVEREQKKVLNLNSEQLKTTRLRRIRILKKRLKKFDTARERYLICETNLETIEDTIRYIYEQSITLSNAEEVGFRLDELLEEMEETSSIINDLNRESFDLQTDFDEEALDAELKEAQKKLRKESQGVKE